MDYVDKEISVSKEGEVKKSTTFRKELKNGGSVRVSVDAVDNGFIIRMSKDWKDSKGEWHYINKELISTEDPSEKLESFFGKNSEKLSNFAKIASELTE